MQVQPEIHLFIIWEKGLHKQAQIESDLKVSFEILSKLRVTWPKEIFSRELSRFYGENLPKNSHKERQCGNGTFACYVVRDTKPNYQPRKTSKGLRLVNTNLFDKKSMYRKWTNHGHLIHATDNISETKTQLLMLTGETYESFMALHPIQDLAEAKEVQGFQVKTLEDLFYALNATVNYVVLRNYESLDQELNSEHPDIDLLTDDSSTLARVLNAEKKYISQDSVQYRLMLEQKEVSIDIRSVGDDYYCARWQRAILKNRRPFKGMYVPHEIDHFYSLLYHALLHKKELSLDYQNRLGMYAQALQIKSFTNNLIEKQMLHLLIVFMDEHNFTLVEPKDLSVHWNHSLVQSAIPMPISPERARMLVKQAFRRKIRYRIKKLLGLNVDKYKNT